MDWSGYQPRFIAYCKAHGAISGAEMLARDDERYPGGVMTGFVLWIGEQWHAWKKAAGHQGKVTTEADHANFDQWLSSPEVRRE